MKRLALVPVFALGLGACGSSTEPSPDAGPRDAGTHTAADYRGLVINEVVAAGSPDWFELENTSDHPLDLAGVGFTDSPTVAPFRAKFPAGTTIAAGGFLARDLTDTDPGFKLGADEVLALFAPDGSQIDLADWSAGDAPAGRSWGRWPDGTGAFATLETPTKGAANSHPLPGPNPSEDVVLNEVTSAGDDQIELFNRGTSAVRLAGWAVTDDGWIPDDPATDSHHHVLADTTLAAGDYLVLVKGVDHAFGLGDSDGVTLYDTSGAIVDEVAWQTGQATTSYCRRPNGTGAFQACATASFGAANP